MLLLFNSSEKLPYNDIKNQLNLSDDDVTRLLHSLSCAKYKILLKEPNSRTIDASDTFQYNEDFTDKMRRIRVRAIPTLSPAARLPPSARSMPCIILPALPLLLCLSPSKWECGQTGAAMGHRRMH